MKIPHPTKHSFYLKLKCISDHSRKVARCFEMRFEIRFLKLFLEVYLLLENRCWSLIQSLFLRVFPPKFSYKKIKLHQRGLAHYGRQYRHHDVIQEQCFCTLRCAGGERILQISTGLGWYEPSLSLLQSRVKFLGPIQSIWSDTVETFSLIFIGFPPGPGRTKTQPQINPITNAMQVLIAVVFQLQVPVNLFFKKYFREHLDSKVKQKWKFWKILL